ncbi:hypothetical protein RRG08_025581 [Elysia crispata]|uniref:Uncharacterized protein n=1 Tax=Elysia crispata TaxID=231223 RepID=A0AAE0YEW7_9GAST|nr:hypothetical protein RRG08_025581 [Elysia crispata]
MLPSDKPLLDHSTCPLVHQHIQQSPGVSSRDQISIASVNRPRIMIGSYQLLRSSRDKFILIPLNVYGIASLSRPVSRPGCPQHPSTSQFCNPVISEVPPRLNLLAHLHHPWPIPALSR